jgi:hypothetical protein
MDAIGLRGLERILAVLIGGLAIYLGYRLFARIPDNRDAEGKFTFPGGFSIWIARVGPGVFFALFGAAVVGLSFHYAVTYENGQPRVQGPSVVRFWGAGTTASDADEDARTDARKLLRRDIAVLNTLPEQLASDLPAHDKANIERAIARIKLALMKPVWAEAEGWGTPENFERWQREGDPADPPKEIAEAVKYFNYPSSGRSP